jgi:hypothetical protein
MPNPIVIVACSVLAFVLAASSDWLETRYVRAVHEWEQTSAPAPERAAARERAARASVSMWLVSVLGLVTIVQVGWWVLLPEGLGLYVGTRLALAHSA